MMIEIPNPYPEKNCFYCGSDNAMGLQLKFYRDEEKDTVFTEYLPQEHFVGQGDILHGGIQMGLLDEIMGWTCQEFTRESAVTSDIDVRFLQPTYICGEKIRVSCRVISREGPRVTMEAVLLNSEGQSCTTAKGTYHVLSPEKFNRIIHRQGTASQ